MQSRVSCDVILDPKEIKFLLVGKVEAGFRLGKYAYSSDKNANLKKLSWIMTSRTLL